MNRLLCTLNRSARLLPIRAPRFSTFSSLIEEDHRILMNEEIALMKRLSVALRQIDAPRDDIVLIDDTSSRIADFFTVVVVGEFNAGKQFSAQIFIYVVHSL